MTEQKNGHLAEIAFKMVLLRTKNNKYRRKKSKIHKFYRL